MRANSETVEARLSVRDKSFEIDTSVGLGLQAFEFLFGDPHVLIFGVLEAADEILALSDDMTHGAIVLIAHARAAFLVQQMKGNVFAFRLGMNADGDRY
jgi:hypothetical protein